MNFSNSSKLAKVKVLVAVLGLITGFTLSMPAFAQTLPPPPDKPAPADTVNPVTETMHRDDGSHDRGGWLALFGLAVLLGLLQKPELHMRHRNTTRSSQRRPD